MIRNILWVLLLSLFIFTAKAQKIVLDLDRCIELATDSSLQAFRAKNLYMAGYWAFRSYKAGLLPSLSLRMTPIRYTRDFTQRYDSENNIDVYRKQQMLYSYGNLSLSQSFTPTGGTFFIDSELGYMRNFGLYNYSQFSAVPVRIGYSQALFGFNSMKWEKKIEPLKYEKAQKDYLYAREEIAASVIGHFFTLAMAQNTCHIARENVASTDTLYRIGQERYKIASISQSDLLTLRLDAINARNTYQHAEMALQRAMFNLLSFLNLDKETNVELMIPEYVEEMYVPVAEALAHARRNNPDFLGYRQELLTTEREVDRTKKSSAFEASLSASIGFNQVADHFSGAYRKALQQDVVSVGLTIPILDWGVRKGKVNMARNNLNVTRISIQQKIQELEQDIIMATNDFNMQRSIIHSAQEARELADLAYKVTRERFVMGKADLNSLTLSLNRRETAQQNYISALREYWANYYKIRKLTLYDFQQNEVLTEQFERIERMDK